MEWDTSSIILEYLYLTRVLFFSTSTLTWQHVFDEVKTFTPTHLLEAAILMYKNTEYYYTECGAKGRLQLLLHLFIYSCIYFGRVLKLTGSSRLSNSEESIFCLLMKHVGLTAEVTVCSHVIRKGE